VGRRRAALRGIAAPRGIDVNGRIEANMDRFPVLRRKANRQASTLSGGEQKLLEIVRGLLLDPQLMLVDEPSIGLSPLMTERVLDTVRTLARDRGLTVVIVEQRVSEVLEVADIAHVLDHGRIVRSGLASALRDDRQIQETYMGL
jgi:branched-chain amino acid transport system ATP-binding protein